MLLRVTPHDGADANGHATSEHTHAGKIGRGVLKDFKCGDGKHAEEIDDADDEFA